MPRRLFFRFAVIMAAFGLAIASTSANAQDNNKRGRKYKSPPPTSRIEVTIVRDSNGKPIENASVIFHTIKDPGNMELKTNEDGKALIDVLQIGETVRLQIIAKGFQTYGQDYEIDQPQMAIDVRMKRPGEQYSIYKKHDQANEGGKSPETGKPDTSSPKSDAKDKSADDKKPDAQPSQPQSN